VGYGLMASKYLGYAMVVSTAFFAGTFAVFTYDLTAQEVSYATLLAGSALLGAYTVMAWLLGASLKLRNGKDMLALGTIIMSFILALGAILTAGSVYSRRNFITSLACPAYSTQCMELAGLISYPVALGLLTTGLIGTYTLTYLLIKEVEATYWIKDYGSLLVLVSGILVIAASILAAARLIATSFAATLPPETLLYALTLAVGTVLYVSAVFFALGVITCCYLLSRELIKTDTPG